MPDPDALEAHRKQVVADRRAAAAAPRAVVPTPRRTSYAPPTGRMGSTPSGRYTRPAPPPVEGPGPIPSLEDFLTGDTGYQQQLRQFAKALTDLTADVTRRRGTLESEYGVSTKALEDQRIKDLESLEEDFGSRGLLKSGLYGTAVGDYQKEFGERMSDLSRRQQEALGALQQEQGQFGSQTELQKQAAREAAIRRRAEQYGV